MHRYHDITHETGFDPASLDHVLRVAGFGSFRPGSAGPWSTGSGAPCAGCSGVHRRGPRRLEPGGNGHSRERHLHAHLRRQGGQAGREGPRGRGPMTSGPSPSPAPARGSCTWAALAVRDLPRSHEGPAGARGRRRAVRITAFEPREPVAGASRTGSTGARAIGALNSALLARASDARAHVSCIYVDKGVWVRPATLAAVRERTRARLVHFTPDPRCSSTDRGTSSARSLCTISWSRRSPGSSSSTGAKGRDGSSSPTRLRALEV